MAPALGKLLLAFPDEDLEIGFGALWDTGINFGAWASDTGDGPVAMILTNNSSCVACLLGAIRAGVVVISLPLPPRAVDLAWYQQFVTKACSQLTVKRLIIDDSYIPLLPPLVGIRSFGYNAVLGWRRQPVGESDTFGLVQFTSGSTSEPKGVELTQDKLLANIHAILQVLNPEEGDGACSWLPISHDMGLIGMLLCSMVGAGLDALAHATCVLVKPETFLRRPSVWLEACSHYRSTITASPNFGLEMAIRRPPAELPELDRLRVCFVGGEPVRAETLKSFAECLMGSGFSPLAFCPAYGLAEAGVAVSLTPPSQLWSSLDLDGAGTTAETTLNKVVTNVVAAGTPMETYRVETSTSGVGELMVSGPSLAEHYSDGTRILDELGRFHTSDLGFMCDDKVYVVGRVDDVFLIAGRKVYAFDVEDAAEGVDGVRAGRCVAIVGSNRELVVIAELTSAFPRARGNLQGATSAIKRRVSERIGVSPADVVLLPPGTLPMTSSGKIQRKALSTMREDGRLEELRPSGLDV
jgi:acyl-CoA synthetase (AMP-forming)/AMP-acid ligase II